MAGTEVQALALEGWFCPLSSGFGKWARTDHVCSVDGKLEVPQVRSRWSAPIVAALCYVLPGVYEVNRASRCCWQSCLCLLLLKAPRVTTSPVQHLHPARKREMKSFPYKLIVLSNPKRKGFSVLFPHIEVPSIILPVWIPGQAVHVQNKSSQTPQGWQGCLVHGEGALSLCFYSDPCFTTAVCKSFSEVLRRPKTKSSHVCFLILLKILFFFFFQW